jgi:glycosyltransferase involved in cell wall biosynthesis
VREWAPFSHRRLASERSTRELLKAHLWFLRPGVHPSIDSYDHADVRAWLNRLLNKRRYGVAVIEELSLARYIRIFKQAGCRVVFDAHNVEGELRAELGASRRPSGMTAPLQRLKRRILRRRLAEEERHAIVAADLVWACSDHDAREMKRLYGVQSHITVVPNTVNVDAYSEVSARRPVDDWRTFPIRLIYPGTFGYQPNEDAAMRLVKEVLPALRCRGYKAEVVLVGRAPTSALMAMARQDQCVRVTGPVDSVLPYLEPPCVVALPIVWGSGTRLKILEAFAAGVPVVSTRKGAEGIDVLDGQHILLRDGAEAMADAVISLWTNLDQRAYLCANALELVGARYSWPVAARNIMESLDSLQPGYAPSTAEVAWKQ